MRSRPCTHLAVVAVLGALLPSAATAAPTWLPTTPFTSPAEWLEDPHVDVAPDGTATAVWLQAADDEYTHVRSAVRAPGHSWGSSVALSTPTTAHFDPQVAVAANGRAVAAWNVDRPDALDQVVAALRSTDGSWSSPTVVSSITRDAHGPQVAIAPDGTATVVWQENGAESIVRATQHEPGGSWASAVTLSSGPGSHARYPTVGVADDGTATAGWIRAIGGAYVVQTSRHPAGGSWSAPVGVSDAGGAASSLRLAVSAGGEATAVWLSGDSTSAVVEAARRPAEGPWGTPVALTTPTPQLSSPRIASTDGAAVATWMRFVGDEQYAAHAARWTPAGWDSPADLAPVGRIESVDVAIAPNGRALATWRHRTVAGEALIEGVVQEAGEPWGTVRTLSAAGLDSVDSAVGFSPTGDGHALWDTDDGALWSGHSAVLDGSGPALDGLTVPSSATTGADVAMTVSPSDVWSALGTTTWTFGDGTTATGTAVSHRFAAAGPHTVTVTAGDVHGNRTTAQRTIDVTAVGTSPGPPQRDATCTTAVRLASVERRGRTVRIVGGVTPELRGRKVQVVRDGRTIATTTVKASGAVVATVTPPKQARRRAGARYRLRVGNRRSATLTAQRYRGRASVKLLAKGKARVTGRIRGVRKATTLQVRQTAICGSSAPTTVQVRTTRSGRFTVTVAAPASAGGPLLLTRISRGKGTPVAPFVVAR